jgi:hypothetical protein
MARLRILCRALPLIGLLFGGGPAMADTRPVVVELFTSQGCSSCPPADALLCELAGRSDLIALGFHISYWDKLGWRDPLSNPASTERQKAYARRLGGQIYTPQVVVDGTGEAVGSDRGAVFSALRAARPEARAPVSFAGDRRSVAIGAGDGTGDVILVRFVQRQTTQVGAGENSGRVLEDANAVEALATPGAWDGTARRFPIEPPTPGRGLAILVQAADGAILGAAKLLGPDM